MKLFNKNNGSENVTKKKKKQRRSENDLAGLLLPWAQIAIFVLFLMDIYVIASIFSLWTGSWGRAIQRFIIENTGGAAVILLIYAGYLCMSFLLRKRIAFFFRQLSGTIVLFICCAHVLGLFRISGTFLSWPLMSPGKIGTAIASGLFLKTGALGAFLGGFILALVSSALYGFININILIDKSMNSFEWLRSVTTRLKSFMSRMAGLKAEKIFRPKREKKEGQTAHESERSIEHVQPDVDDLILPEEILSTFEQPVEQKKDRFAPSDGCDMQEISVENTDTPEGYFKNEEEPPSEDLSLPAHLKKGVFPPPMDLFGPSQTSEVDMDRETIAEQGLQVISTLADFGIQAELAETVIGPTVIQFQIQLAPGVKVSRVAGLSNDLAVSLAVPALRVEAPIPFKPYVGIEIPRPNRRSVTIRSILDTDDFRKTHFNLPLAAGLKVNSSPLLINLEDLPHLLVAGTTGSGKSVFVTSCITGLCCQRTPDELRLLMIDPKRVELNIYENLPHVLSKPVVDPRKAVHALGWAVREMEHRYEVFARTRVRNLASYNSKVLPKDKLPRIVIIVDELADLMFTAQKEVEDFICRLAQMARATGIHLILATQRPSVNVITGLIKANIPARVAFTLPSQADSRTIIDVGGAEKLLGKGDMLFVSSKYPRPVRVQAPYMDETQSLNFISYMKDLFGEPEYVDLEDQGDVSVDKDMAFLDDPLIEEAVNIILGTGIASASRLQRQLRIGFTRAARIIDTLEQMGIVGPQEGSKPREILADEEKVSEIFENIG